MMSIVKKSAFDNHEAVHFYYDEKTGYKIIIAIHSTKLGPAAGGCRFWYYDDEEAAAQDALRLSQGMSYKNAMADLPYGGGKAVIMGNKKLKKNNDLFEFLGRAVEGLGGRYITAEDVGISIADMEVTARYTSYVSGLKQKNYSKDVGGDPSPKTALGVFQGISAAAKFRLGLDSLAGLSVAVQGVGGVGFHLCHLLHKAGAGLLVSDINAVSVKKAVNKFGARAVAPEEILGIEADILAPCALGGILNETTIPALKVSIVAGGANNQLGTPEDGKRLLDRDILYAPDYIINSGGIINVIAEYSGEIDKEQVDSRIEAIYGRTLDIFQQAKSYHSPTNIVADKLAKERILATSGD